MAMKVQNVNRSEQGRPAARSADTHGADESGQLVFRKTLSSLSDERYKEHIQALKKGIDDQAERLGDKVDVKEYEKYRQLIREFLDEIVSNGYTFNREDAYASRGRHKFIATVKTINQELDELGKEVLKEQSDKIEVMAKLDDIRGLLLDLMM